MNDSNPAGRCQRCGEEVRYRDRVCPSCGAKNTGWVVPDDSYCGNCHARLREGDRYCRICGTRAGEGKFEPYQQVMQCIYGPMPLKRIHRCQSCGYSWSTCAMIDDENYCPKCGGNAPSEVDDRDMIQKLI